MTGAAEMKILRRVLAKNRERNARQLPPQSLQGNRMSYHERRERIEPFEQDNDADMAARKLRSDQPILYELIKVLAPHPGGLRRWSVMRAIRNDRERASRDISQKFEDEVERTFRRFCADADNAKTRTCDATEALFYRPREKAGEVWAIFPDRAKAWLASESVEVN
jgi:hypothetical protein